MHWFEAALKHLRFSNSQLAVWISGWPTNHDVFIWLWKNAHPASSPQLTVHAVLYVCSPGIVSTPNNGFGFLRVNQYVQFGCGCICLSG